MEVLYKFSFSGSGKATWRKQPPSKDFAHSQGLFESRTPGMLLEREVLGEDAEKRPGTKNKVTRRRWQEWWERKEILQRNLQTTLKGLDTIGPHSHLRTISLSRVQRPNRGVRRARSKGGARCQKAAGRGGGCWH